MGFGGKKLFNTEKFYNNMISFPFHVWMTNKEFKYLLISVKKSLIELRKMRNLKKKEKNKMFRVLKLFNSKQKKDFFLLLILITVASILEMTSLAIIVPIINLFLEIENTTKELNFFGLKILLILAIFQFHLFY